MLKCIIRKECGGIDLNNIAQDTVKCEALIMGAMNLKQFMVYRTQTSNRGNIVLSIYTLSH
jgi:hypothetical protein